MDNYNGSIIIIKIVLFQVYSNSYRVVVSQMKKRGFGAPFRQLGQPERQFFAVDDTSLPVYRIIRTFFFGAFSTA